MAELDEETRLRMMLEEQIARATENAPAEEEKVFTEFTRNDNEKIRLDFSLKPKSKNEDDRGDEVVDQDDNGDDNGDDGDGDVDAVEDEENETDGETSGERQSHDDDDSPNGKTSREPTTKSSSSSSTSSLSTKTAGAPTAAARKEEPVSRGLLKKNVFGNDEDDRGDPKTVGGSKRSAADEGKHHLKRIARLVLLPNLFCFCLPRPAELSKDGGKRRKTAVEEIMEHEESRKEQQNRKDYWLSKGIVVKVMNKKLADGAYYKMKGVVRQVHDKYVGEIEMLDSGDVIKIDQNFCETVIPVRVTSSLIPPFHLPPYNSNSMPPVGVCRAREAG